MTAQPSIERLKRCVENHTFDSGDPDYKTVTNQLYRAYAESHEDNPLGIRKGFNESESFLKVLPLADKLRSIQHLLPNLRSLRTQSLQNKSWRNKILHSGVAYQKCLFVSVIIILQSKKGGPKYE